MKETTAPPEIETEKEEEKKLIVNCSYNKMVKLHKLVKNPKNPNHHSMDQIKALAKIIDYTGMRQPIVVSKRSGFITKGHGRLMALELSGYKSAPVDYQGYIDEAQEYADMVADNAIAEWSTQDLGKINEEMAAFDGNFDLEYLGIKDFALEPAKDLEDEPLDTIKDEEEAEININGKKCPQCGFLVKYDG